jgi:chaperonin GroEL (HSP60 family)
LESEDVKVGYNASTGVYEDMFAAGIIDPAKVSTHFLTCLVDSLSFV